MHTETENKAPKSSESIKYKIFICGCVTAILINLVFFISGYISFNKISLLHSFYLFEQDASFTFLSIFTTTLTLIAFFYFYLAKLKEIIKHQFNKRYFYEFLLLFLLVVLNSSYFVSYRYGFALSAKNKVNSIDLVDQINLANTSLAFLPMDMESYEKNNKIIDPKAKKEINSWAVNQDSAWKAYKVILEDSLRRVYKLDSMDQVFLNYYAFQPEHKRKLSYHEEYVKEVKAIKENKKEYSYYYYQSKKIGFELTSEKEKNNNGIASDVTKLLQSKNLKEIENLLKKFQKNLNKTDVLFRFDAGKYALQSTGDSIISVDRMHTIGHIGNDHENHEFINLEDYKNFLQHSASLKLKFNTLVWTPTNWLYLFLWCFALSFVVFIVRVNGVLGVGTSLLVAVLLVLLLSLLSSEPILLIVLTCTLLALVYFGNKKALSLKPRLKQTKLVNIASFCFVLFWVSLFQTISSLSKPKLETFDHEGLPMAYQLVRYSKVYFWLNNNLLLLLVTLLIFSFLIVLFYFLPLSKKIKEE